MKREVVQNRTKKFSGHILDEKSGLTSWTRAGREVTSWTWAGREVLTSWMWAGREVLTSWMWAGRELKRAV